MLTERGREKEKQKKEKRQTAGEKEKAVICKYERWRKQEKKDKQ